MDILVVWGWPLFLCLFLRFLEPLPVRFFPSIDFIPSVVFSSCPLSHSLTHCLMSARWVCLFVCMCVCWCVCICTCMYVCINDLQQGQHVGHCPFVTPWKWCVCEFVYRCKYTFTRSTVSCICAISSRNNDIDWGSAGQKKTHKWTKQSTNISSSLLFLHKQTKSQYKLWFLFTWESWIHSFLPHLT